MSYNFKRIYELLKKLILGILLAFVVVFDDARKGAWFA